LTGLKKKKEYGEGGGGLGKGKGSHAIIEEVGMWGKEKLRSWNGASGEDKRHAMRISKKKKKKVTREGKNSKGTPRFD